MPEQRNEDVRILYKLLVQRLLRTGAVLGRRMVAPVRGYDGCALLSPIEDVPPSDGIEGCPDVLLRKITRGRDQQLVCGRAVRQRN